jgi:hypothetical protein
MYKHFEKDPKGEENKLTDEEIVKALECCTVDEVTDCENCPLLRESCAIIRKYALDFINRQKAEIERLTKRIAVRDNDIGKLESEIDDLKYELKQAVKDTAKEILQELYEYPHEYHEKKILEIARRKGVEVE